MQQTTYFYLAAKGKHFLLSKLNKRLKLLNLLNNLSSWHLFLLVCICFVHLNFLCCQGQDIKSFFSFFLSLPGFPPRTLSWHPSLKPLESWNRWFRICIFNFKTIQSVALWPNADCYRCASLWGRNPPSKIYIWAAGSRLWHWLLFSCRHWILLRYCCFQLFCVRVRVCARARASLCSSSLWFILIPVKVALMKQLLGFVVGRKSIDLTGMLSGAEHREIYF